MSEWPLQRTAASRPSCRCARQEGPLWVESGPSTFSNPLFFTSVDIIFVATLEPMRLPIITVVLPCFVEASFSATKRLVEHEAYFDAERVIGRIR